MENENVPNGDDTGEKTILVDEDMLRQIEQSNDQQARYAKKQYHMSIVGAVCALVILIVVSASAFYVLPMAEDTYTKVNQIMGQVNVAMDEVGQLMTEVSEKVNEMDIESLNTAIKDVSGQVKSMNIEELNRAIKNLSDIMEPLAKFFR